MYTVQDPDDLDAARYEAIMNQCYACMRASAHPGSLFNFRFFVKQSNRPAKKKKKEGEK